MINEIQQLAERVGDRLNTLRFRLATAESCTGGGFSYLLTTVPGSSSWFERGFITYSNTSKIEMLGIDESTINAYGAVSAQTAQKMAEGALKHSEAEVSVAITGIAGPEGGTSQKPVGTIWIAFASVQQKTESFSYHFTGNRDSIREQTIKQALEKLLEYIG